MHVERWTSPSGKRRLLTRLDAWETQRYAAAAALAVPHGLAGARSFGCTRPGGERPPWVQDRRAWREALRTSLDGARVVVAADVADCYPSVEERAIQMAAARAGGDPGPLLAFLTRTSDAGVRGLPIGPAPSSLVADAVLGIADERARVAGIHPVRWVDDVMFAGDRDQVARAARAWRSALGDLGLHEHDGKRLAFNVTSGLVTALGASLLAGTDHGIMRTS
jgi:hypothetical protein